MNYKSEHARKLFKLLCIEAGQDFHTLTLRQVWELLVEADKVKYRKPKNAIGSRARYFYAKLLKDAHNSTKA